MAVSVAHINRHIHPLHSGISRQLTLKGILEALLMRWSGVEQTWSERCDTQNERKTSTFSSTTGSIGVVVHRWRIVVDFCYTIHCCEFKQPMGVSLTQMGRKTFINRGRNVNAVREHPSTIFVTIPAAFFIAWRIMVLLQSVCHISLCTAMASVYTEHAQMNKMNERERDSNNV